MEIVNLTSERIAYLKLLAEFAEVEYDELLREEGLIWLDIVFPFQKDIVPSENNDWSKTKAINIVHNGKIIFIYIVKTCHVYYENISLPNGLDIVWILQHAFKLDYDTIENLVRPRVKQFLRAFGVVPHKRIKFFPRKP